MSKIMKFITGSTSSADITAALEKASADLVSAEAAVEKAAADYDNNLLSETPAALRKLRDAKAEAEITVEQCIAVIAKLERELEKATESEAETARRVAYDRAKSLSESARKKLHNDYPRLALAIRETIGAIAEADVAVAAANEARPDGEPMLFGPESDRSTANLWREILAEDRVEMWAPIGGQSSPIVEELQRKVQPYAKRGRVGGRYADGYTETQSAQGVVETEHGLLEVVRRTFIRRKILPDQPGFYAANLASELALPALMAGDEAVWQPSLGGAPTVLAIAEKPLRQRPERAAREPVFEYSPA